ncbi:fibrillarin-like rRNA/tRNA 2'-O-methyltransferase [Candidatus Nanohalococcus occultus]|uniref:fibrillarin-like rRNA/tRNA 2'-O-methyltransferase n=1 Tax=Candidatus Nanohalococcus occultus TaxID=2978047 RepID=UPI0039E0ECE7
MKEIQPGVFRKGSKIFTKNAVEGQKVYGEELLEVDGLEYREWNPHRSKAGGAIAKDIDIELNPDSTILYLGAASGTTVSHFSDILTGGFLVGIEYSDTVARKLLELAEKRENIAPILGDARKPEEYEQYLDKADIVFQDISQSDQPEIFLKNCRKFLKEDGVGLLAVKAKSISSSRPAEEIYEEVIEKLEEQMEIVDRTTLEPYETDHLFLKLAKK